MIADYSLKVVSAFGALPFLKHDPSVPDSDVTIEYLRPGRAQTTYARADVRKVGRRIANVHVEAWQDHRASPVAALRGHFLLSLPQGEGGAAP